MWGKDGYRGVIRGKVLGLGRKGGRVIVSPSLFSGEGVDSFDRGGDGSAAVMLVLGNSLLLLFAEPGRRLWRLDETPASCNG